MASAENASGKISQGTPAKLKKKSKDKKLSVANGAVKKSVKKDAAPAVKADGQGEAKALKKSKKGVKTTNDAIASPVDGKIAESGSVQSDVEQESARAVLQSSDVVKRKRSKPDAAVGGDNNDSQVHDGEENARTKLVKVRRLGQDALSLRSGGRYSGHTRKHAAGCETSSLTTQIGVEDALGDIQCARAMLVVSTAFEFAVAFLT
jgi:hypothetical protein